MVQRHPLSDVHWSGNPGHSPDSRDQGPVLPGPQETQPRPHFTRPSKALRVLAQIHQEILRTVRDGSRNAIRE